MCVCAEIKQRMRSIALLRTLTHKSFEWFVFTTLNLIEFQPLGAHWFSPSQLWVCACAKICTFHTQSSNCLSHTHTHTHIERTLVSLLLFPVAFFDITTFSFPTRTHTHTHVSWWWFGRYVWSQVKDSIFFVDLLMNYEWERKAGREGGRKEDALNILRFFITCPI